jgi:hypothetical protein
MRFLFIIIIAMGIKEFFFEKLGINRKKKKPDTIEHTKA